MQNFDIEVLEAKIGYTFSDRRFLTEALTHSSYANELKAKKQTVQCNERLEFLGDSVLSVIVSEYLFDRFSDLPEGELTQMRAMLVQSASLSSYSREIVSRRLRTPLRRSLPLSILMRAQTALKRSDALFFL